jgi:serine/threonine protein kinase
MYTASLLVLRNGVLERLDLTGKCLEGRYQITRVIGEGGMGRVYQARQIMAERDVAVKVISERRLGDPRAVRRFLEEARTSCAIHHPNVVTVHDFGSTSDGLLYLVMELLEGSPLRAAIAVGALVPSRAISIAVQICAGLEQAHRRAIIHRDLKPDNIMLCEAEGIGDLAKILDFGLAVPAHRAPDGKIAGSPSYMSPEQALGRAVDARSDLYAVGVLLYEMLSGRVPFVGDGTRALLEQQVAREPPPLRPRCPHPIPEELEQLVLLCLAKRPDDRPRSAMMLREALARVGAALSDGKPLLAYGAGLARTLVSTTLDGASQGAGWSIELGVGATVGGRYRVTGVDQSGHVTAVDALAGATESPVEIRRVLVEKGDHRAAVELAIERWSALLPHLRHPSLVPLLDCTWAGPLLILVSARRPTASVRGLLVEQGRLAVRRAVEIARDVCAGLDRLHGLGLLHHGITSSSVRINEEGGAVLAETALGALVDAGLPLGPMAIERDRRQLAPERLSSDGGAIGPHTDLYELGTLLYEMLAGVPPWATVDEYEVLAAKLRPPLGPGRRLPSLPPRIDAIVARLLSPAPGDRYPTAAALAHDLTRFLDGEDGEDAALPAALPLDADGRLHGRAAERAKLGALVDETVVGRGALAVLRGPMGAGKSRLLQEAADAVRSRGGLVLRTKGREGDLSIPMGGARRLLDDLSAAVEGQPAAERDALLDRVRKATGRQGALLRPFGPLLERCFADAPEPPPLDEAVAHQRLLGSLCGLFVAASRPARPLCLIVDDLQWLDEGTRRLLEYLAQAAPRASLLVLAATRPASGAQAQGEIETLVREGGLLIELGPLDGAAVAAFVAERVGDPPGAARLAGALERLSDGNPVSLRILLEQAEQVGALVQAGDRWQIEEDRIPELARADDVVRRLGDRLRALPHDALEALGAAAVWGASFDVPTLGRLLDDGGGMSTIDHASLVSAIAAADRTGVLHPVARGRNDFVHDSLRQAALAELDDQRRRQLHRRAAEAIAVAPDGPAAQQRIAEHLLAADPRPADADPLEHAARASLAAHDGAATVRFAQAARDRSSDGPPERRLALELLAAKGFSRAHLHVEAIAGFESVLAARDCPRDVEIDARRELARAQHVGGRLRDADATLDGALRRLGVRPSRRRWLDRTAIAWRILVELLLGLGRIRPGRNRAVDERHRRIAEILSQKAEVIAFFDPVAGMRAVLDAVHHGRRSHDDAAYARTLATCGLVLALGVGWTSLGARVVEAAVLLARSSGDLPVRAFAQVYALKVFLTCWRTDPIDALLDETRELVGQVGDPLAEAGFETFRAEHEFVLGRVDAYVGSAIRLGELVSSGQNRRWFRSWSRGYGVSAAVTSGRPDLARRATAHLLEEEIPVEETTRRGILLGAKIYADAQCGALNDVLVGGAEFVRSMGRPTEIGWYPAAAFCNAASGLRLAAVQLDSRGDALRLLGQVVAMARRVVRPYRYHALLLSGAEVHLLTLLGRKRAARRLLDRVIREACDAQGRNHGVALVLRDLAFLEGGRETAEGRRLLRVALNHLDLADGQLPLKRELSGLLGEPLPEPPGSGEPWTRLARALGVSDT